MVSPIAFKPCDKGADAGNDAEIGCDKSNQGTQSENHVQITSFRSLRRGKRQLTLAHTARRSALIRPRFMENRASASVSAAMNTVSTQSALDNDALFVSDINFVQLINKDASSTWSARVHKQFEGKTMRHMAALLGRTRFAHRSEANPVQTSRSKQGPLPEKLDWREIENGIYLTPVRNQGGCGSCYSVAATDVATIRLRIQTKGKDKTILSPQHVVSCSILNQGCDGGYPFLVGKHGSEMGFVPESCQSYTGGDGECNSKCYQEKVYRAKNYRYIGGYYGATNEHAMMMELQDGPIVVAINAPGDLFYYHNGVYKTPLETGSGDYNVDGKSRWEKTNHAVVAVGYGQQEKDGERLKYWWIKNSWAKSWGMDGYFKVLRGTDAMAIESMSVAFDMDV